VGPSADLDAAMKIKVLPCRGSIPRFHTATRRYTGCAVPAPNLKGTKCKFIAILFKAGKCWNSSVVLARSYELNYRGIGV
jgi:hypothetical protein